MSPLLYLLPFALTLASGGGRAYSAENHSIRMDVQLPVPSPNLDELHCVLARFHNVDSRLPHDDPKPPWFLADIQAKEVKYDSGYFPGLGFAPSLITEWEIPQLLNMESKDVIAAGEARQWLEESTKLDPDQVTRMAIFEKAEINHAFQLYIHGLLKLPNNLKFMRIEKDGNKSSVVFNRAGFRSISGQVVDREAARKGSFKLIRKDLEWTRDEPSTAATLFKDTPFEARFEWGRLGISPDHKALSDKQLNFATLLNYREARALGADLDRSYITAYAGGAKMKRIYTSSAYGFKIKGPVEGHPDDAIVYKTVREAVEGWEKQANGRKTQVAGHPPSEAVEDILTARQASGLGELATLDFLEDVFSISHLELDDTHLPGYRSRIMANFPDIERFVPALARKHGIPENRTKDVLRALLTNTGLAYSRAFTSAGFQSSPDKFPPVTGAIQIRLLAPPSERGYPDLDSCRDAIRGAMEAYRKQLSSLGIKLSDSEWNEIPFDFIAQERDPEAGAISHFFPHASPVRWRKEPAKGPSEADTFVSLRIHPKDLGAPGGVSGRFIVGPSQALLRIYTAGIR